MVSDRLTPADLVTHLRRMRVTTCVFLVSVPLAAGAVFLVSHRGQAMVSPVAMTLVAVAAGLWIGFTANRDAERRLEQIKRAGAVHGDERRLLRDHWLVYLVVLLRLEMLPVAGLVVALWGLGPSIGVWLVLLGGLLIALTWPTARKTQLLLGRVRAVRGGGDGR
jgi:hypothetical protein